MFGGLKKSASRLALVAAAGVLSTGAMAADLGGDCCADLEERVAELEATTARKGNRRVSLQVYGWVNKAIMHWNAPAHTTAATPASFRLNTTTGVIEPVAAVAGVALPRSGTYLGQDNTNSATRFGFRGDAKISPTAKAGYSILLDVASGARTGTSTRQNEEIAGSTGFDNDNAIRMRDANVWLESSSIGRLTLGRFTGAGPVGTIDLGGIGNVAPGTLLSGTALVFADGTNLATATDFLGDYNHRQDGLKYDSPTFAGFVVSASIGETTRPNTATNPTDQGRVYGVALRYAGEFSGVRVAAGIGYERSQDIGTATPAGTNGTNVGGSLALSHAPTGLFAQGAYGVLTRDNAAGVDQLEAKIWNVQAGIGQNWFGLGKTTLYGEYHRYSQDVALPVSTGTTSIWGLGVTQDIDAAAMQLYAGYRNHSRDNRAGVSQGDIGVFLAGARINF